MSQVFRVTVSNVRIPVATNHIGIPVRRNIFADISSSFTVLLSPRFNSTGGPIFQALSGA